MILNEESNENMVRLIYEDFNNRNFVPPQNSWDKYLTEDFIWTDPGEAEIDGEGFTKYFAWMVESFPDMKASIDIILTKGNTVVVKYILSATFSKDFKEPFSGQSIPAHGKKFSHNGVDIYEVENSKIKSCTTYTNPQLFMNKLLEE